MGWGSGGELASEIESGLAPYLHHIPPDALRDLGEKIAKAFRDMDCDTLHECDGFIGDAANRLDNPDAPKDPGPGDKYKGRWGTMVFDGRRWQDEED